MLAKAACQSHKLTSQTTKGSIPTLASKIILDFYSYDGYHIFMNIIKYKDFYINAALIIAGALTGLVFCYFLA